MKAVGPTTVSAIITTHNRQDLVRRSVRSVLGQTVVPHELVVVDDGSNSPFAFDGEETIPVRLVRHGAPMGPGAARNAGVAASTGRFVGFLDDDDEWLPTKIESCLRAVAEHSEADLIIHRAAVSGSMTNGSGRVVEVGDPVRRMLLRQPPHVDAVLVSRDLHRRVLFDETFPAAADLDYMLRLAMEARQIVEIDEVLAIHGVARGDSKVALEKRIAGRQQFRRKHAHLFEDPAVDAFYWLRLGHQYRRAGRPGAAAICFTRALTHASTRARAGKGLVATTLPKRTAQKIISRRTRSPR